MKKYFVILGLCFAFSANAQTGLCAEKFLKKDYVSAKDRCLIAANQGDAEAQNYLGLMYYNGIGGVQKNYLEAVKWYTKSANQGIAGAQFTLASMYDRGQGVPQNYLEAVKWYTKAASQGYAHAQNNLAFMYYRGAGVSKDMVLALKWITLTVAQEEDDKWRMGTIKWMEIIKSEMTHAEINEAQKLALEFVKTN